MILKEKPQILDNGNLGILLLQLLKSKTLGNPGDPVRVRIQELLAKGIPDWIKSVMASYNQMTKVDQDEFLKLNKNVHSNLRRWYSQRFLQTALLPETLLTRLQTVIGQTFQVCKGHTN